MMSRLMVPLRRYAEFGSRSSRAEFWKWMLVFYALILIPVALMFLGRSIIPGSMVLFGILAGIVFLGGIVLSSPTLLTSILLDAAAELVPREQQTQCGEQHGASID